MNGNIPSTDELMAYIIDSHPLDELLIGLIEYYGKEGIPPELLKKVLYRKAWR